jgi:two-component system sensor kinase
MAGTLPSEATDFIVRAANGSPFMASAAVRGLVESEAITYQHDGWRINQRAFEDCQSSKDAGEFLGRRLALLSPETVEFLSAAAVVGKEFDYDAVGHLADCDISAVMGALEVARRFGRPQMQVASPKGGGVLC